MSGPPLSYTLTRAMDAQWTPLMTVLHEIADSLHRLRSQVDTNTSALEHKAPSSGVMEILGPTTEAGIPFGTYSVL